MSEWQPARLNWRAHPNEQVMSDGDELLSPQQYNVLDRLIVRVREVDAANVAAHIKKCGCKRFFEIHPRDLDQIGYRNTESQRLACEAEIVTD